MIYRADHTENFVQILNSVFWDPRISLKAKAMVGFLLALPDDDFNISRHRLASIGPDGEKAIRSGLKELTDAGYLDHRLIQDERGRWRTEPDLYEDPRTKTDGPKKATGRQPTDGLKQATSFNTTRGTAKPDGFASPRRRKTASTSRRGKWENGTCIACNKREVEMAHLGAGLCDPCARETRAINAELEERRAAAIAASSNGGNQEPRRALGAQRAAPSCDDLI